MLDNYIKIYDTTLRDGTQREGISLSCDDKLRIAQRLDDLGVSYIEGGWPGSNPKDVEFFDRMPELDLKTARISAFGSTCRADSQPEEDSNIQALILANTPTCTLVGKSWTLHVTDVIKTTQKENLRMIQDSVAHLKHHKKEVIYDAEHFFDGFNADPAYAMETILAAQSGGADTIVLCDTNGGTMPWQIASVMHDVKKQVDTTLGIHTHDNMGLAMVNTATAVEEGRWPTEVRPYTHNRQHRLQKVIKGAT